MSKAATQPLVTTLPAPFFVADSLALDFLNSVATPYGKKIEWLADGERLIAWMKAARLITEEIAVEVRKHALPGELDSVASEARTLREWFRGFVLKHKGKSLARRSLIELAPLNELLARDETHLSIHLRSQLVPIDGGKQGPASPLESVRLRRWRTASSLLFPLAETMAALVSSADFSQVKKCQREDCAILMYDTTQRHARRWCTMALCGNRAKQAAFRNRSRRTRKVR